MSITYEEELDFSFDFEPMLRDQDDKDRKKGSTHDICKFFLRGHCIKGASCPFKHIRQEKAVVCKHWLRGLCKKGDDCEFLHEYNPKKMPECWFFAKYGECTNPECIFLHIKPEDKVRPCPWYNRGFCKRGPLCSMKHITRVACPDYMAGFCAKGTLCKFAHPKWEMPREDDRLLRKRQTHININSAPPSYMGYTQTQHFQNRQHHHRQQNMPPQTKSIPTFAGEGAYFEAPSRGARGDDWNQQPQHHHHHHHHHQQQQHSQQHWQNQDWQQHGHHHQQQQQQHGHHRHHDRW